MGYVKDSGRLTGRCDRRSEVRATSVSQCLHGCIYADREVRGHSQTLSPGKRERTLMESPGVLECSVKIIENTAITRNGIETWPKSLCFLCRKIDLEERQCYLCTRSRYSCGMRSDVITSPKQL